MIKITSTASTQVHSLLSDRNTCIEQSRPLSSRSPSNARPNALQPHAPTHVTLSPHPAARQADGDCYNRSQVRLPRNAIHSNSESSKLSLISSVSSHFPDANQQQDDEDSDNALNAGNSALQKISSTTVQNIASLIFSPDKKTDAAIRITSPTQFRREQLSTSSEDVAHLLRRQPDSRTVLASAFQQALQRAFPSVLATRDPDQIYVTQYAEHEIAQTTSSTLHPAFERTPTSSMTLTAALLATLNGVNQTSNYNQTRTGFFRSQDNADSSNEIAQMKGTQHLLSFEKILQETITASAQQHQYRQALRQFWNSPDATLEAEQTPRTWLAHKYGEQRLIEAQLRISDGTLTASDQEWLTCVVENRLAENSPGAFSISLQDGAGDIPFSGILVLTQSPDEPPDSTPGRVLLVIPGQGLLAYRSSTAYRQGLQQLFDTTSQRAILLTHVARENREHAATLDNLVTANSPLRYRAISGPAMLDRIQSRLNQQARDVTYAALSEQNLPHANVKLDHAADLLATFDIRGVRQQRQQLILEKFLQAASKQDQTAWFTELKQYQMALQKTQTSGFPAMWQFLDPEFLTRYARDHIRDQIKQDLKLDINPDQVTVTTYTLSLPHTTRGDLPAPPQARQPEKISTRSTLTELALMNTRILDLTWGDEFPVNDDDGKPLPPLTRGYLTRIIRAANIGQRYQEFLQSRLLDSSEGLAREQSYADFLQAQLQLDVREAKISGDITSASAHWVQAALKRTPMYANNELVHTRNLYIDGKQLNGIFVFATPPPKITANGLLPLSMHPSSGSARLVMYTPDAPDGKRLREYDDRAHMVNDFINHPIMRDYLLQRVELGRQGELGVLLNHGATTCNVRLPSISGNFTRLAYRTQVQHIIANADARTTTNSEADQQAWWDKFHTALDIAGIFLPLKLSLPLSLVRAGYAFYNSHDARRRGSDDGALIEFINGINLLGGAVSDGLGVSMNSGEKLYRANAGKKQENLFETTRIHTLPPAPATAIPAGMTAVQIDGLTYYYWYTKNSMVHYRDLFVWDQAHQGQLKSAGYGAPGAHNVWTKISPLQGGGDRPARQPGAAAGGAQAAGPSHRVVPIPNIARPIPDLGPVRSVHPVVKKTMVAGGRDHFFSININGRERDVAFNLEKNAFHEINSAGNSSNPTWYVLRNNQIHAMDPAHRVTAIEREATLRALDIDLKLPLSIPNAEYTRPIPRIIRSIWIGDRVIPDELVSKLGRNAFNATLGKKIYRTKLYLSNQHPLNFQTNLDNLTKHAPLVDVITLEDSRFYHEFRASEQGKYFVQYQAALNGSGGIASNYSSAADILRYRLLFHKGGLYMDLDDTLHAVGDIDIKTSSTGLALNGPVSNSTLGMDAQYNTSMFGSQQYNATLDAISEESYRRFQNNRDLYTIARPRKSTHSERQISDYMKRVSYVTGPDVFNKVVNERLPEMYQLREAIRLRADSSIEISTTMQDLIDDWQEARLPLNDVNQIGNTHSWEEYR